MAAIDVEREKALPDDGTSARMSFVTSLWEGLRLPPPSQGVQRSSGSGKDEG